jgi:hypothetical protein
MQHGAWLRRLQPYDLTQKMKEAREKVAAMPAEERDQYAAYGYVYWSILHDGIDDAGFRRLIKTTSQ